MSARLRRVTWHLSRAAEVLFSRSRASVAGPSTADWHTPVESDHPSTKCTCGIPPHVAAHADHAPSCPWLALMCKPCGGTGWCAVCGGDGAAVEQTSVVGARGALDPEKLRAFEKALRDCDGVTDTLQLASGADGRSVTLADLSALLDIAEAALWLQERDEHDRMLGGPGLTSPSINPRGALDRLYRVLDEARKGVA
jgi:hypothetical protein